jgi:hypothetical protein
METGDRRATLALGGWCSYSVVMAHVVDWDGEHVPAEMRSLPPGRYLVEALDEAVALTPEEEEGLREAMVSLETGHGRSLESVRERVLGTLKR